MRRITLKMPRDGNAPDRWAGQRGEHRMTQLVIPMPKEDLANVRSCVALFMLDDDAPQLSPLILPGDSGDAYFNGGKVYLTLWRSVTNCRILQVQLECFGDTKGEMRISRSPISERIRFGKSIAASLWDYPEVSTHPSAISELISMLPDLRIESAKNKPCRVEFGPSAWQGSEPNLQIIVPASEHQKGIYARVTTAGAERSSGAYAAALPCWERQINGDITLKSDTAVPGEIFIERGN